MKIIARLLLLLMVFATLTVFYIAGIGRFPDYENYLSIADSSGFVVSEHDYLFEWFSRFLLGYEGVPAADKVFVLATLNQLVCVIFFAWVGLNRCPDRVYGALFLFCLLGFLFMTTTLRASAAYLCISAFFLRGARLDYFGTALLVFSIAWHDSAASVVFIYFASIVVVFFVSRYKISESFLSKLFFITVFSSGALILLADTLRALLPVFIGVDLGARTAYFEGDGGYSLSKSVFLICVIYSCYNFVVDCRQSILSRIFISLMVLVLALFNSVNGIMAVRFSFFIFSITLPLRGVFIYNFERRLEFRMALIIISPLIFCSSALYTFSNVL